jgi:hypothetical protein
MLTGITTRPMATQEDGELWPSGSARPVLEHLTGTVGMTRGDAVDLLGEARARSGPGTLTVCHVAGGELLIHYAPGSRAYRFKLA